MQIMTKERSFMESIYTGVDQAIFVIDVTEEGDFRFAGLNAAHEKATGLISEKVLGKTPDELVPALSPAAARAITRNYAACLESKGTYEYEETIHVNGVETHWLTRLTPLKDEKGRIFRIVGSATEMTGFRKTQEAFALSEERYRSLFENAKDMIHLVDSEGRITHVNRSELETLGYSKEEMIGRNFMDFIDPEHLQQTKKAFRRVRNGKSVDKYETVMLGKSGKKVYVQVSVVPELKDGHLHAACAIIRDVTDSRSAAMELAATNRQLVEKNRELEQIVFVTSHDLRSPLVNIQGFSQELEISVRNIKNILGPVEIPGDHIDEINLVINQEIPEALDFIKNGICKMDSLLKGLLSISRLGRRPLEKKRVLMNALVEQVVNSFIYQIREKGITLEVEALPDCIGDEGQLNQVFSNLLDNAIKYLDENRQGIIRITGKKEKKRLSYAVEDNGIGIPRNKQEKIFEIFHKHEPGRTGEGLGLTIVRKIMEKHQGNVEVESEPGKGSRFIITLPASNH
jgi:PAS domain S-box-containing protein